MPVIGIIYLVNPYIFFNIANLLRSGIGLKQDFMKRSLLFFFLLLFVTTAAVAQTSLAGKVVDEASNEPIIFGTVVLYRNGVLKSGTETDFDGNYSFSNIDPGTYDVEFSYTGYQTQRIAGVQVLAGKAVKLDAKISQGVTLDIGVTVVDYRVPLIQQDNTTQGAVLTSDQIRSLPTRNINALAATSAGLGASDEGAAITVRGSRSDATNYYVDGVRVLGNLVQESEIDQLQVITGGVEARYGDVTGGVISITTKGPSDKFSGGVELESSRFLDAFNNNLAGFNLSGPILRNKQGVSVLGFRLSGRYTYNQDDDPTAVQVYRIKDDKLAELEANPVIRRSGSFFTAAEFLNADDVTANDARLFEDRTRIDVNGKLDARLSSAIDISLSGGISTEEDLFTPNENSATSSSWRLLNAHNNPTQYDQDYRVNFRFRHRLGGASSGSGDDRKVSTIQNASYTLQLGYEHSESEVYDSRHKYNYFNYGHVARFDTEYIPVFDVQVDPLTQQVYLSHVDYREVLRNYTPAATNAILANYNNVLGITSDEQLNGDQGAYAIRGVGEDAITIDNFYTINGRTFDAFQSAWGFHTNVGSVYGLARQDADDVYIFNANMSFDLLPGGSEKGRHSIQLGIAYEGRTNRRYQVVSNNQNNLWRAARQNANSHIQGVVPGVSDTIGFVDVVTPFFTGQAPLLELQIAPGADALFYRNLRESLGIPLTEFVNVDELDPSQLSIDMFSAKELNDQRILDYYGYDYMGNAFDGTFLDFFTARDPLTGVRTFPVAPNRPIYASAFIQDKFTFRDIIFRLGVRVDRYDANTKVLKDPYSLYEIQGAAEFHNSIGGDRPGNIGDDYKVYTTAQDGTDVQAYRDGNNWYKADGTPVNGPQEIENIRTGLVFPKYRNDDAYDGNYIKSETFNADDSFKDYEVQFNVMPRLAFSFPISEDANFFAHYDVLVQRPPSNTIATALDYFYFVENNSQIANNPALRPERTVDYEVGFQQRVSASSAIKIAAYYKELRDMIQLRTFFPVPLVNQYTTYDNQDFGTVKGFSFQYDLRRTGNVTLNANYTLQFADGTGSDPESQRGLTNRGNLRTLFPLNFDERHRINLVLDYRYGSGKSYNGPTLGGLDLFADAGLNLQAVAVSGRPYTAKQVAEELGGAGTVGSLNGARKPWNFTLNLRVDKNFNLGDKLGLNVYVRVSNLLDRLNIINVYPVTGSAEDDGFLRSFFGQQQLQSIATSGRLVENYLASYQWRILNDDYFSLPRRIFLGAILDF